MKIIFFIFSFSLAFSTANATVQKCSTDNEIRTLTFDSLIIDFYFRPKSNFAIEPTIFFAPKSVCLPKNGGRIEIVDAEKKIVGHLVLGRAIHHTLTAVELETSKSTQAEVQTVLSYFAKLRTSIKTLFGTYLLLNFETSLEDEELQLNFFKISQIQRNVNYWSYWNNPEFAPSYQKNVTPIDYTELTRLLQEKAQVIDAQTEFTISPIPSIRVFPIGKPVLENFLLSTASTLPSRFDFSKLVKNRPVVVYSEGRFERSSFMVLMALRLAGFKKLYWYREGLYGLLNHPSQPSRPTVRTVTITELAQSDLSQTVLFDLRPIFLFAQVRIPGSVSLSIEAIRPLVWDMSFPLAKGKIDLTIPPFSKIGKKRVIIMGLHAWDEYPYLLAELLIENGMTNVLVVKEGFIEWNAKTFWQVPKYTLDRKPIKL